MFQAYFNEDGIIITSKSEQATINGWCQEFTKEETAQLRAYLSQVEKKTWWNKLKSKLRGKNKWQK